MTQNKAGRDNEFLDNYERSLALDDIFRFVREKVLLRGKADGDLPREEGQDPRSARLLILPAN